MKKSTSTCIPRKSKCASGARNLSTILCATRFARRSWVRGRSPVLPLPLPQRKTDRKSTRLNSSHSQISYAVFCLKKKIHTRSREAASDAIAAVHRALTLSDEPVDPPALVHGWHQDGGPTGSRLSGTDGRPTSAAL